MTTKKNAAVVADLAAEARRAIEATPSFALLSAAKGKLADLNAQAAKEDQEVARLKAILEESHTVKGDASSATARVQSLLAGKGIPANRNLAEELRAARERVYIIRQACLIQASEIQQLEGLLGSEAKEALKQIRQPLVTRIAESLRAIRAQTDEEAVITNALIQAGARLIDDGAVAFRPCASTPLDEQWFKLQRERGYSV